MARAIARVPSSKGDCSNSPTGPFQRTVRASASERAKASIVFGPMSRPRQPAGMATPSVTRASAAPAEADWMR
jgi:hypothetical protein